MDATLIALLVKGFLFLVKISFRFEGFMRYPLIPKILLPMLECLNLLTFTGVSFLKSHFH
jgi:hypothetical protein